MPLKPLPPCGYIREVCYNDHVPEVKRPRTQNKRNAEQKVAAPMAAVRPRERDADTNALLIGLLLGYCLS